MPNTRAYGCGGDDGVVWWWWWWPAPHARCAPGRPAFCRRPRARRVLSPTTAASRLGVVWSSVDRRCRCVPAWRVSRRWHNFPSRPEGDACDCGREYFSRRLTAGCLPNPPRLTSFSNGSFGPCRVPGLLDRLVHLLMCYHLPIL